MTAETLESLRASFNRRLRAEGKADRTLVLYGQSITYFSEFLAQEGLRADLDNLTRDNVLTWLESLRTRKLTDGTIRTRWRGIRRFVGWLVTEGIIDHDPLAGITVDKPEPPPVPILDDDVVLPLGSTCDCSSGIEAWKAPSRSGSYSDILTNLRAQLPLNKPFDGLPWCGDEVNPTTDSTTWKWDDGQKRISVMVQTDGFISIQRMPEDPVSQGC
jgi:integrase